MNGLIKNNFYNVEGSLKISILIGIVGWIAIVILGIGFPDSDYLIPMIVAGVMGGFGTLAGTVMQKDNTCKWNKFELTLPISRKDVIKARYISFLLYILMGIFMAIVGALLFYITTGDINLERVGFGLAFGTAFAMSLPTFLTPLVLIFGADKIQGLHMISVFLSLGLFFGSSAVLMPFLKELPMADLLFRLGYFIFSTLLFVLSYFISIYLYKRKEL